MEPVVVFLAAARAFDGRSNDDEEWSDAGKGWRRKG
jgi:hypothetical protein